MNASDIVHINIPVKRSERETIARRAKAADLPMYRYILELATTGKLNKKRK